MVFEYLQHIVNITTYHDIIEETTRLTDLFPASHVKKLINADLKHMDRLLQALDVHHRNDRSINVLGTALKIIAGTPEFDEFEVTHKQSTNYCLVGELLVL